MNGARSAENKQSEPQRESEPLESVRHDETGWPGGGLTHPLLQLQQTIGNRAVGQMLRAGKVPPVQRRAATGAQAGRQFVQRRDNSSTANKTGLPDNLKTGIENLSGMSMDDVTVHYNSREPKAMQALAYTKGAEIHLGPGQEKHLPHEAWHVVQQKQGRVQPTLWTKGVSINDSSGLESEATVKGLKAARTASEIPESKSSLRSVSPAQEIVQGKFYWTEQPGEPEITWIEVLDEIETWYSVKGDPDYEKTEMDNFRRAMAEIGLLKRIAESDDIPVPVYNFGLDEAIIEQVEEIEKLRAKAKSKEEKKSVAEEVEAVAARPSLDQLESEGNFSSHVSVRSQKLQKAARQLPKPSKKMDHNPPTLITEAILHIGSALAVALAGTILAITGIGAPVGIALIIGAICHGLIGISKFVRAFIASKNEWTPDKDENKEKKKKYGQMLGACVTFEAACWATSSIALAIVNPAMWFVAGLGLIGALVKTVRGFMMMLAKKHPKCYAVMKMIEDALAVGSGVASSIASGIKGMSIATKTFAFARGAAKAFRSGKDLHGAVKADKDKK